MIDYITWIIALHDHINCESKNRIAKNQIFTSNCFCNSDFPLEEFDKSLFILIKSWAGMDVSPATVASSIASWMKMYWSWKKSRTISGYRF
jgi:hypothetical protein